MTAPKAHIWAVTLGVGAVYVEVGDAGGTEVTEDPAVDGMGTRDGGHGGVGECELWVGEEGVGIGLLLLLLLLGMLFIHKCSDHYV